MRVIKTNPRHHDYDLCIIASGVFWITMTIGSIHYISHMHNIAILVIFRLWWYQLLGGLAKPEDNYLTINYIWSFRPTQYRSADKSILESMDPTLGPPYRKTALATRKRRTGQKSEMMSTNVPFIFFSSNLICHIPLFFFVHFQLGK